MRSHSPTTIRMNVYNYNNNPTDANVYAPSAPQQGRRQPSTPQRKNKYPLWKNILAMILLVVVLVAAAYWAADVYTRHGQEVAVPDVKGLTAKQAIDRLEQLGLQGEVTDSIYSKNIAPGLICEQSIHPGNYVKIDRIINLRVSSNQAPTITIPPGIIDNTSKREATARLVSLGFTMTEPEYTLGQKDWVLGIKCNGRNVTTGSRIDVDAPLTLIVGNGQFEYDSDQNEYDTYNPSYDSTYNYEIEEGADSY